MDRTMPTLRKVLRENDFETFIEKIEKIENLKIAPFLLRRQYCPAIDDIRFWLAAVGLFATGVDNTPALLFLQIGVSSRMFALQLVFRRASARNAQ